MERIRLPKMTMPLQELIFSGTRNAKLRSFPFICGALDCPFSVSKITREALAISSSRRCLSLPIAASPFIFDILDRRIKRQAPVILLQGNHRHLNRYFDSSVGEEVSASFSSCFNSFASDSTSFFICLTAS